MNYVLILILSFVGFGICMMRLGIVVDVRKLNSCLREFAIL